MNNSQNKSFMKKFKKSKNVGNKKSNKNTGFKVY